MRIKTFEEKIDIAENNLIEWYEYWEGRVAIAFSGGKDSTVLLHLARQLYPDISAFFVNTGLEYPEIVSFVKKFDNIDILRPKMPFHKVVEKYGYPIVSKAVSQKIWEIRAAKSIYSRQRKLSGNIGLSLPKKYRFLLGAPFIVSDKCCHFLKKEPMKRARKELGIPIIGVMAEDSRARRISWRKHGCNAFNLTDPTSRPIMSWTSEDVWKYIKKKKIDYCSIYDKNNLKGTGCMFCGFGLHMDQRPNRFETMKKSHPKQYDYIIDKLKMGEVLDFWGVPYGKSQKKKRQPIVKSKI